MPIPVHTLGDLVIAFLSGAVSAGASQPNPAASLGGYRSGSRADSLGVLIASPIPGVRIDYASPDNGMAVVGGVGVGSLLADGGQLVWTPPPDAAGIDAEPGEPVAIDNGQQAIVAGADSAKFLLVTRTSADDLFGSATVTLARSFNDVFGQADAEISDAPSYRLLVLQCGPAGTARDLKLWIGSSDGTVRIAREDPASQPDGAFQTIADATTPPTGVTWVSPTSAVHTDVVTLTLRAGEQVGLWIERTPPATPTPRATLLIHWSYTAVG